MMNINIIESVTLDGNYAALLEKSGRYGVAQMIGTDHKMCFYDDRALAKEVFDMVAEEVRPSGKNR